MLGVVSAAIVASPADADTIGQLRGRSLTNPGSAVADRAASGLVQVARTRDAAPSDAERQQSLDDDRVLLRPVVSKLASAINSNRFTQAKTSALYLVDLLDDLLSGPRPGSASDDTRGVAPLRSPIVADTASSLGGREVGNGSPASADAGSSAGAAVDGQADEELAVSQRFRGRERAKTKMFE